jgi:inorganic pyrophosphatase
LKIPKCSRKKFEIATNEPGNPIKQDVKKGKLREFQKGDVYFNYGCLPRTWEDPDKVHPDAKERGDNDPLGFALKFILYIAYVMICRHL